MKRAGKIGRWGRAAIVAALSAGFVLLSIPAANAGNDWELIGDNGRDAPHRVVYKINKPVAGLDAASE